MLLNAVVLAFREIRRNVLRSSLTTLGCSSASTTS